MAKYHDLTKKSFILNENYKGNDFILNIGFSFNAINPHATQKGVCCADDNFKYKYFFTMKPAKPDEFNPGNDERLNYDL